MDHPSSSGWRLYLPPTSPPPNHHRLYHKHYTPPPTTTYSTTTTPTPHQQQLYVRSDGVPKSITYLTRTVKDKLIDVDRQRDLKVAAHCCCLLLLLRHFFVWDHTDTFYLFGTNTQPPSPKAPRRDKDNSRGGSGSEE